LIIKAPANIHKGLHSIHFTDIQEFHICIFVLSFAIMPTTRGMSQIAMITSLERHKTQPGSKFDTKQRKSIGEDKEKPPWSPTRGPCNRRCDPDSEESVFWFASRGRQAVLTSIRRGCRDVKGPHGGRDRRAVYQDTGLRYKERYPREPSMSVLAPPCPPREARLGRTARRGLLGEDCVMRTPVDESPMKAEGGGGRKGDGQGRACVTRPGPRTQPIWLQKTTVFPHCSYGRATSSSFS